MPAALERLKADVVVPGYTYEADAWWEAYDNDKSLTVFGQDSYIRQFAGTLCTNTGFDNFILFLILLSTILMVLCVLHHSVP